MDPKTKRKRWYEEWLLQQGTSQEAESVNQNEEAVSRARSSGISDVSEQRNSTPVLGSDPLQLPQRSAQRVIPVPQFYFPNCRLPSRERIEQCISEIAKHFSNASEGLLIKDDDAKFKTITKEVCHLPSFFSSALFRKIQNDSSGLVTRDEFVRFWVDSNMLTMDTATQVYKVLKHPDRDYLAQVDFMPILEELLETHPDLEIIKESPKIRKRYAATVTYRIFYHLNRNGDGRLTLGELRRGNLMASMQLVDEEQNIDKERRYFSYKHFYVIFCMFGRVDRNHDFLIEEAELIRYDSHSLTSSIVERIFSEAPKKFTSGVERKMNYEDFVYFYLSEMDKSTEHSIKYWFKCLDVDQNEALTPGDLQVFFKEQRNRIKRGKVESMSDQDMFCRLVDMIAPKTPEFITLRDLKRSKLSEHAFNMIFNLKKWEAFQSQEASEERRLRPELSGWDCFAEKEYAIIEREGEVLRDSEDEFED